MPATIFAMPDSPDPTATTVQGHGWVDGAWTQIHEHGSWARIPEQPPAAEHVEPRNQSAWMAYGIRPTNIVLPQANSLDIRLRLNRFTDATADHQANVRLLVRDIAAADPHRKGIRALRARERLSWQARTRPADVTEAHQVVTHFDQLQQALGQRIMSSRMSADTSGVLAVGYMLAIGAMALAPAGPQFRAWQVAFAAIVAVAVMFHIGRQRGWKYGYNQALWHCAEVLGEDTRERDARATDAARRAEQAAREAGEAARNAQLAAAEAARLVATRRMAFELSEQAKGEGYLYVVEFSTGTVKVGLTEDPKSRLGAHRSKAAAFGVHIANYWISPSHSNFRANETRLINQCAKVSPRSRKEYFHAVGYERAKAFAAGLTYFSDNDTQISVEGVWA